MNDVDAIHQEECPTTHSCLLCEQPISRSTQSCFALRSVPSRLKSRKTFGAELSKQRSCCELLATLSMCSVAPYTPNTVVVSGKSSVSCDFSSSQTHRRHQVMLATTACSSTTAMQGWEGMYVCEGKCARDPMHRILLLIRDCISWKNATTYTTTHMQALLPQKMVRTRRKRKKTHV